MSDANWTVHCTCGEAWSNLTHTVCPHCFQWPHATRNKQVREAFDMIAKANSVSILSLDEMESIVNRALSGEFDRKESTHA